MPKLKLIASDLDGTLLLNGAQSLRPDTCGLIQALHDKGISFFAASGRQYTNLQRLFAPIRDEIGYVCENGTVSFYKGKMIHRERMDRELGQEIIRTILARGDSEVMVAGVMVEYIQPKTEAFYHHLTDVVKYDVAVVPDILRTEEEYMKISVYEREGIHDEAFWRERFGDRCSVAVSGVEWLDMMSRGVSKASGLKSILDKLGISPEECMAIGDNDNDREMLELVGYPVAVKSAKPGIRAIAKIETDTVEHLFQKILSGNPDWDVS